MCVLDDYKMRLPIIFLIIILCLLTTANVVCITYTVITNNQGNGGISPFLKQTYTELILRLADKKTEYSRFYQQVSIYMSKFLWPSTWVLYHAVLLWLLQVGLLEDTSGYADASVTKATAHAVAAE